MQKVEGSNPFSRSFRKPACRAGFRRFGVCLRIALGPLEIGPAAGCCPMGAIHECREPVGNGDTATASGYDSTAPAGRGDNNIATATARGCFVTAFGDGQTATC